MYSVLLNCCKCFLFEYDSDAYPYPSTRKCQKLTMKFDLKVLKVFFLHFNLFQEHATK